MSACPKHPKFNIENGIYYRAANPDRPTDWVPKSERKRSTYYAIAARGDLNEMAGLMGEAQMIHSNESSTDSGYLSVARCPVCLSETTDPTVRAILASISFMCRLDIRQRNEAGAPFIFHVAGSGIGAAETEGLVLLPDGKSLLAFHDGYITPSFIASKR